MTITKKPSAPTTRPTGATPLHRQKPEFRTRPTTSSRNGVMPQFLVEADCAREARIAQGLSLRVNRKAEA